MARLSPGEILIRRAYADDQLSLLRLAALDSAVDVPASPLLVAELDGELRVALSLADGAVIADPFVPTADIVALLRLRAESELASASASASRAGAGGPGRFLRRRLRGRGRRRRVALAG
jgi:hypothetical protein